jgi:hypothetical protein
MMASPQHEQAAALSSFHGGKRRAGFDVVHSSVVIQSDGPRAPCAVRCSGRAHCCQHLARRRQSQYGRRASRRGTLRHVHAPSAGAAGRRLPTARARAPARPSRGTRQASESGHRDWPLLVILPVPRGQRGTSRWPRPGRANCGDAGSMQPRRSPARARLFLKMTHIQS